jgi:hypothetical protein
MTETAADNEYFVAAEAAFIRRRGTPFLLSPRDFSLLREWRALGIPLEAVEQGIDDAFSRREERGATGRVNSLWYCRDAVLSAWERRAEAAAGRGGTREQVASDSGPLLEALERTLAGVASRRPDLHDPLDAAQRSIARLLRSERDPASLEASLARLDKKLASALYASLPEAERDALDERVRRALEPARARMDEETAEKTMRALTRRAVREHLDLPRLTLLT